MCKLITFAFVLCILLALFDCKKIGSIRRSSKSSKTSSSTVRRSDQHSQHSQQSQPLQPKSSLFGWQEQSAAQPRTNAKPQPSYPSSKTGLSGNAASGSGSHAGAQQSHSYPSSQTGLSGNSNAQKHSYPQNNQNPNQQSQVNQQNQGYPASSGMSGQGTPLGHPGQTNQGMQQGVNQGHQMSYPRQPPPYSENHPSYGGQYASHNRPAYSGYHPQGPPPPYSNMGNGYGHPSQFGGHNQMPGYFGGYNNNGRSFSRGHSTGALAGAGLAGAGIGTVLTGLALWNLARSTGNRHHTVIYDNRGQPVGVAAANETQPNADSILGELVSCTLSINNNNETNVLAIPCSIATSFGPDTKTKNSDDDLINPNDKTECTITVVTKDQKEFSTKIPCSLLLNTAAENNVTEPVIQPDSTANVDTSTTAATLTSTTAISDSVQVNCTNTDGICNGTSEYVYEERIVQPLVDNTTSTNADTPPIA